MQPDHSSVKSIIAMNAQHKRIWLCIELAALLLLTLLLLGKAVLPGWHRLNTDFPNYYLVARLLRDGYNLDRIYDWVWLQRIKDHWSIDQPLVGFAGLTPLSALPVLSLAGFAALTAKRIWIVSNLLFLVGTVEALHGATSLNRRRIWILSLLAIIPLRTSFLLGQMHILVLLLMALAYFFRSRARGIACGVCLALAGALKVYPLLFFFYFAWKKQWREALSIACAATVLLGISYACIGSHITHIYLTQILPRSMQGEVLDPYNVHSAAAAGFFHRLFIFEPDLNPLPVWNRPLLYSIFYPLWQAVLLFPLFLGIRPSANNPDTEKLEWAAFLVLLLVLSPVPSSYHFVVMILPVVLFADVFIKRKQYGRLAVLTLLYFMVCGVSISPAGAANGFSFLTILAFTRLWTGLLIWGLLVIYLWYEPELHENHKALQLRSLALFAIVLIFWISAFAGYQRHFAHLAEDIRARLRLPIHPLIATGIRPKTEGFVSTVMTTSSYRIADQNGQFVSPIADAAAVDQLSAAATVAHSQVFVELADKSGSRVVPVGAQNTSGTDLRIPDAESPALSADGASLAYIREEKGRGSLWLSHLAPSVNEPAATRDAELAGGSYDVRDAAFAPSGNVVFTARINGKTNIYQLIPAGKPAILVADPEEVESPDISPDGQWLVFRKLLHNRWQLVMMNLDRLQERQLTFGDCNAFAPAWMNVSTIAYSTDCGRGLGLTALASIEVDAFK